VPARVCLTLADIQDHNGLLKAMRVDSWQQPPEDESDVEAEGVEGRAEHERPNVAAYRANIVAAGHGSRLALIRASSVLTAASTLVAEAATSLNLAGCTIVWCGWRKRFCSPPACPRGYPSVKILLATGMPEGLSIGTAVDSLCSVGPERSSKAISAASNVVTAVSKKTLE
jgi:hypothetical protein